MLEKKERMHHTWQGSKKEQDRSRPVLLLFAPLIGRCLSVYLKDWINPSTSSLEGITRSAPFLVVIKEAAALAKVSISFN